MSAAAVGRHFIEIERRVDFLAKLRQNFQSVRRDVDFGI